MTDIKNVLVTQHTDEEDNTILLVDDEPINLFVINDLLAEHNLKCDQAESGKKALEMIQKRTDMVKRGLS